MRVAGKLNQISKFLKVHEINGDVSQGGSRSINEKFIIREQEGSWKSEVGTWLLSYLTTYSLA